jgi:hypothetical protein
MDEAVAGSAYLRKKAVLVQPCEHYFQRRIRSLRIDRRIQ